jgi:HEAT repeat protein
MDHLLAWTTGEQVLENQKLPHLRAAACLAIADLPEDQRGEKGMEALVSRILDKAYPKEVKDYAYEVQKAAAEGLIKIGSEKAAPALIACLEVGTGLPTDNKDPRLKDLRLIAAEGLDKIVSGDKPAPWEMKTDEKVDETQKRWKQFVSDWRAWLAKKQGT